MTRSTSTKAAKSRPRAARRPPVCWPTGLLKKATNPDGSFVEYVYDAAHRLTEIRDGALNRVVYTLDNMGNRTAENTYDPSTAPETIMRLAQHRPDLRPVIALNPAAWPELLNWLSRLGDPAVDEALRRRNTQQPGPPEMN